MKPRHSSKAASRKLVSGAVISGSDVFAGRLFLLVTVLLTISYPDPAAAAARAGSNESQDSTSTKRTYVASDFARFAPRTAYDLLVQVPGFVIRAAEQERGLGQASENVLINGERIANKSGGAIEELQRIPVAKVDRIDIVDAANLGIAGLSGQVANVILRAGSGASGQFEWQPQIFAHYAEPNLFRGSASYSGTQGRLDYNFSIKDDAERTGYGGPILISDGNAAVTERRREIYHFEGDIVTVQTKLGLRGPGSSLAHLSLGYSPYWGPAHIYDTRVLADGENRSRNTVQEQKGWFYDVNADAEFAFGPGRLKAIALQHFEHQPVTTTQILRFDSTGADPEGSRFRRDSHIAETVGRLEYGWKSGRNDWQMSLERAFNSIAQKGSLFELNPDGEFVEMFFPEGSGKVREIRYEALATVSRPIGPKLSLQVNGGAEISNLGRVDDDRPARRFFRPKGSATLGWTPTKTWSISLTFARRVGQISFYDFLAQPMLTEDHENAGNPDLVPPQSWEAESEISHDLGRWGKTTLRAYAHRIENIIDIIPLPNHGEGIGNLPRAARFGMESTSTLQLDPLGWTGAKIDAQLGFEHTSVQDPLTHIKRSVSGIRDRWMSIDLRHDVPRTQLAWGVSAAYEHFTNTYFLTEVSRTSDGPWKLALYVEHKKVMGLAIRAEIANIFNSRHRWTRFVYQDWRDSSPLAFIQRNNEFVGPNLSLTARGTF